MVRERIAKLPKEAVPTGKPLPTPNNETVQDYRSCDEFFEVVRSNDGHVAIYRLESE